MTRWIPLAARVYGVMLRLYPPSFQRAFAQSMLEDFLETSRDVAREHGAGGLAIQWARAALDLVTSITWQWARFPPAWAALGALACAATTLQAIALLAAAGPLKETPPAGSEDELTLLMLMVTALLPVMGVIVFAGSFLAPAIRRRPRSRRA